MGRGDTGVPRQELSPAPSRLPLAPHIFGAGRTRPCRTFGRQFREISARTTKPRTRSAPLEHPRHENPSKEPHRPGFRSDSMGRGELYAYYKRIVMLEVYFTLFPLG